MIIGNLTGASRWLSQRQLQRRWKMWIWRDWVSFKEVVMTIVCWWLWWWRWSFVFTNELLFERGCKFMSLAALIGGDNELWWRWWPVPLLLVWIFQCIRWSMIIMNYDDDLLLSSGGAHLARKASIAGKVTPSPRPSMIRTCDHSCWWLLDDQKGWWKWKLLIYQKIAMLETSFFRRGPQW